MTSAADKALPSQTARPLRRQGKHQGADHSSPGDGKRWAVLCDFDGTITPEQTMGVVYRKFAAGVYLDAVQRWCRNEIGTQEEFEICFGAMNATRAELEVVLDTLAIDPGFPAFLDTCRRQGYEFAIVSEGLTWYVEHILGRHGIRDIAVYSNEIHFEPHGFRFSYPWHAPEFPLRGVGKPGIVRRFQEQGLRVAYVGDGLSDYEAVREADVVYARNGLLDHCLAQGIPAVGFVDMADLLRKWTLQGMDPAAVHARGAGAGQPVSG